MKYTSNGEPSLAAPVAELPGHWGTPGYAESRSEHRSSISVMEPYDDYACDLLLAPSPKAGPQQKQELLSQADAVVAHAMAAEKEGLRSILVLRASDDPEGPVVGLASAADPSVHVFGLS